MSHEYQSHTLALEAEQALPAWRTRDDVHAFVQQTKTFHGKGRLSRVAGATRGGWVVYLMRNLLRAHPAPALAFLTDAGHTHGFADDHGKTAVEVLEGERLQAAREALRGLLHALREDPDRLYDADEAGVFSDGDVEAAAARDYTCARPRFDPQVRGDEGQGADYFFVFLRSVLAVFDTAASHGLRVLHVLRY